MSKENNTRGQMLLLFAVLLGVLLIAGAGALNLGAIANQERSDEMETPTMTANEVYSELTMAGDATVQDINHDPSITADDDREERLMNQLEVTYELLQIHLGQTETAVGYSITIEEDSIVNGTRVVQSEPGNATSTSEEPGWEPVQSSTDVRELTIASESVNELSTSTPLRVILDTGSDEIVVEIKRADSSSELVEVNYTNAQGSQAEAFIPVSDPVSIDYIGGTVDKARLPGYHPTDNIESVRIENGDIVDNVTYSIIAMEGADINSDVQTAPSPVTASSESHSADEPLAHPAIYQVTVGVETVGANVRNNQTLVLGDREGN